MTIANATNKSGPYLYNGATTAFAYGFKIDDQTHIRAVETVIATGVEADLVLGVDYTVTGVGADTGSIIITPARAAGKSVVLVRKVPFTQQVVLENQGAYFAKVVEGAFDRAVARDQQLAEQISRAVVVPVSADPTDLQTLIGGVVQLLDNVDAVVTVAGISAAVTTVAANATPTATVATNIAAVVTAATNIATIIAVPGLATQVAADRVVVAADKATVAADKATVAGNTTTTTTNAGLTAADRVQTGLDRVATAADRVQTGLDRVQTGSDRTAAAASAASVNASIISMSRRRNMSVNGSLIDSQENGSTLGTTTGYFYADQKALYKSGTLGVSVQRVAYASLAGGQFAGEFKCTTAKPALGATDLITDTDFVEGSDPEFVALGWGAAGAKPMMVRFEVGCDPVGTYSVHVSNKANNRHCWVPYTVSAGQQVIELQIPGDTGGTWPKADGDIGAVIDKVLVAGSTYVGGTAGVWGGTAYYAGAGQKNFLDNIANVARHTDFGLRADPDATGVYGAYRVGEVDAKYRSERYLPTFRSSGAISPLGAGQAFTATTGIGLVHFNFEPCKVPTGISRSATAHFAMLSATGAVLTAAGISLSQVSKNGAWVNITVASGLVVGNQSAFLFQDAGGFLIFTGCRLV